MIEIVKSFFKYILILIFLFLLFFGIIFAFHLLPYFKIHGNQLALNETLKSIIIPSFFHSLYNSFLISIFFYGIFILNYQRKFRLISLVIPLILTSACVFCIVYFLKPNENSLNYLNVNNAKNYFVEKSFFNYEKKLPVEFEKHDFENNILAKISESKDKKIIIKNYKFDFKTDNYKLVENTSKNDREGILYIFYKIGFYDEVKFYFTQVESDYIKNAIIIINDKVNLYDKLKVDFIEDRIFIITPSTNEKYEFNKENLNKYENNESVFSKMLLDNFTKITYKFLFYKDVVKNILFFFSITFLILSFCTLIMIKNYPYISMIIKFAFLILFYGYFTFIFDVYNKNFNLIAPQNIIFIKDWFFISVIIFIGLIFQLIRFLFFKSYTWEKE